METKCCRVCRVEKEIVDFRLQGKYRRTECHECELELRRIYGKRPEVKSRAAEVEKHRRTRLDVKEKQKRYFEELRATNEYKEKVRNDPRRKGSYKKWASKPTNKKKRAKWYCMKRRNDPRYRVSSNFSRYVRKSLTGGKDGRAWKTLVGYSVEELMSHLESLFKDGMTWQNYGTKWHIDHIKPVSSFFFTSSQDAAFKECWMLNNLQPLWASDNIRKGNRT
jgi:hypothetical protein